MRYLGFLAAAASVVCVAATKRFTFTSNGTQIVGYHWSPSKQLGKVPCVVMAHGLGGLQSSRLQPYAERFAKAGYNAITFDYRYWGESAGQPRNIIDVTSQQDDYIAAIAAVKKLSGVDDNRIVIWGTSLSGGHVLELGAKLPELAAVIAQAPHVNGLATVSVLPPASIPGLTAQGIDDDSRAGLGQPPLYIPTENRTGQNGALTQAGAYEGYQFIQPNPPAPGNVFAARFVTQLPFFSPDTTAAKSNHLTYFGVSLNDNITPPQPAIDLAKKMANAELHEYPNAGHFDVYPGKSTYEENISNQVAFLKKNVPI